MPILTGDIKLLASQVMDDVPEGGGAPTAIVIADGVSNAIFPDISELDRAGGRVNFRKLHVSVQTPDRDTYLGSNMIVAEPPADPNVSITLFTTNDTFDTRVAASSRVESYLNKGGLWGGCLLDNHIAGQKSIQILQALDTELPAIGQTLVLIQNEGQPTEITQYIRTTDVSFIVRSYLNAGGGMSPMWVVTCKISDSLRSDFTGSPGSGYVQTLEEAATLRDTVVSDAGNYASVSALRYASAIGDYTVTTDSIFTQLVPSAQTEVPISDIRTNGLSSALVATGGPLVQTIYTELTTATAMHVGGPILPGTLSLSASGVTATDKAGLLVSASLEVGQVDYDNGIVRMSVDLWGGGGNTFTVTFTPATAPSLISDQRQIRVTPESRSLNYALVINPPLPRTLTLSYLAQGRWYVLRDAGAGVLKGINSAYGVGTLNYSTGAIQVTLGALPDVGSSLVIQSYSDVTAVQVSNTTLQLGFKVFATLNTSGLMSDVKGLTALGAGSITVKWDDGGPKSAQDNRLGVLTGDATGTIDYSNGVIRISPNTLPASGTVFTIESAPITNNMTLAELQLYNANPPTTTLPGTPGYTIPATVEKKLVTPGTTTQRYPAPGSVSQTLQWSIFYYEGGSGGGSSGFVSSFSYRPLTLTMQDDGMGTLFAMLDGVKLVVGAVDYETGRIVMPASYTLPLSDPKGPVMLSTSGVSKTWSAFVADNPTAYRTLTPGQGFLHSLGPLVTVTEPVYTDVTVAAVEVPGTNPVVVTQPTLPEPPTTIVASVTVTEYVTRVLTVPNYTLKGVTFSLGDVNYSQLTDGTLISGVSPTTGGGTPVGIVASALGVVTLATWTTGVTSTITNWRGLITPPAVGVAAPFTAFSTTFRTASSPLRPASLSVLGVMQDGTPFNVTADVNGKINGTRVKGRVDYQFGLVSLYFVNPNGDAGLNVDLSALQIAGVSSMPGDLVMLSTLRYSTVAFSYLPLDATLLGIDPVRLPTDGRVPIFRPGGFAVVGNTGRITATVSNAQTIDCARVRLSRVRVVGANRVPINTGYTADLDAGTVTFTDVTGYSQPVTIEHRIEDMGVVRDVQISGEVTFTRALTHDYPLGSFVSSALVAGDLKSRVSVLFDQSTWGNEWSDAVIGSNAVGTYNAAANPLIVTNAGAITERWALVFTNNTTFNIIGEHVGVVSTGSTAINCSPVNAVTAMPYFTIPAVGWGTGWAVGNVLRFNTVGAMSPVWVVRTVQQGPNLGTEHSFTLLSRGDVDRP